MGTIQLMGRTDQGNKQDRAALQAYYDRILAADRVRRAGFQPAVKEAVNASSDQAGGSGAEVFKAGRDETMAGQLPARQDEAKSELPAPRRKHRAAEIDIGEVLRPRETNYLTAQDQQQIYEALLRDAATLEPGATMQSTAASPITRRGRPSKLDATTRARALRLLELGQTRPQAAKRLGLCRSGIGKVMEREPAFARLVGMAERQGKEFVQVFENLFLPYRVVLEQYHVVSTPLFEREKQFLIEQGLPEAWVQRLRAQNCDEWHERLVSEFEWAKQRTKVDKIMALPAADRPRVKRPFKFRKKQFVNRRGQAIEEVVCEATYSGGGKNWEQELKRVLGAAGVRREKAWDEGRE